jgi:hypothetical protein
MSHGIGPVTIFINTIARNIYRPRIDLMVAVAAVPLVLAKSVAVVVDVNGNNTLFS